LNVERNVETKHCNQYALNHSVPVLSGLPVFKIEI